MGAKNSLNSSPRVLGGEGRKVEAVKSKVFRDAHNSFRLFFLTNRLLSCSRKKLLPLSNGSLSIRLIILPLLFTFTSSLLAQSVSPQIGSRPNGIGYASSTLFDEWGVFNNIAGIAKLETISAAFTYDLHSTLQGANRTAAAVAIPTKVGVIGTGVYRFGDNLYNEHLLSAGFSNKFGITSLGAQVNYIQYRVEGFGSKGVWNINLGGITELTSKLSIGAYIVNIVQTTISTEDKLPTKLMVGLGFKPIDKIFIAAEIEKDLDYDPTWKMGIEYKFHEKFFARTGYNVNPNKAFFGLGFNTQKFAFDYSVQHSTSLSLSHQATAAYHFPKK